MGMVSSRELLVQGQSKLPMMLLESYSTISVAKLNAFLTMYLLVVTVSKIDNKNFSSLYLGVFKADKISMKSGQPSIHFSCTLQEP